MDNLGIPKKLEAFDEQEVTETEIQKPEICPFCSGNAEETGRTLHKDELDYEVVVIKKRHKFEVCKCTQCKHEFHQPIPTNLKEENQYGSRVRALALSLMNIGNVSVNKVRDKEYSFTNIECNVHLLRDLQKTTDKLQHKWSDKLKQLLEKTNIERNLEIKKGKESFSDSHVKAFFEEFNQIMLDAMEEIRQIIISIMGKTSAHSS